MIGNWTNEQIPTEKRGFEVPQFNFKNLCSFYVNLWEDVKIAYHSEVKKSMSTIDPMARWPRYLNETARCTKKNGVSKGVN